MDVASFLGTPPAAADAPPVAAAPEAVASALTERGGKQNAPERESEVDQTAGCLGDCEASAPRSVNADEKIASTEQEIVFSDTTPSGMLVEYQAKPKRLYRVNGVEVPSVTTVLNVLDKSGALTYWGMKVGVEGVLELFRREVIEAKLEFPDFNLEIKHGDQEVDTALLVELLKTEKLTVNHVKDKAADRGINVHDAFEQWGKTGDLPLPDDFPDSERGYVAGLCEFLRDADPETVDMEVMVGSAQHGFAGRYDTRLKFTADKEIVVHRTPVRGAQLATVAAGTTVLADLKTSAGIYDSHFIQLVAYELASVESGYPATDAQYVIHVTADGNYEFVKSIAKAEHFLAVKKTRDALEDLKLLRKAK